MISRLFRTATPAEPPNPAVCTPQDPGTPQDVREFDLPADAGRGAANLTFTGMSTLAVPGKEVNTGLATTRPYLLGGLAALSVGAATIHFAVVFEHFTEYALYGVFFLVVAWPR